MLEVVLAKLKELINPLLRGVGVCDTHSRREHIIVELRVLRGEKYEYTKKEERTSLCCLILSLKRAENEARTRDPNLGKVMLYQLSYFRIRTLAVSVISDLRVQRYYFF